ncbi:MAG: DUF4339 domain-containing protein [Alphaproteobacteria bacterium]|nr:DUF4339 domain-containing protein [Alphaproteobacteria bacterium]
MLAAENWCVKVVDKVYGPYTSAQMRKYAHEGRLSARSLISPAGSRAWCEARREAAFANFFGYNSFADNKPAGEPVFGKNNAAPNIARANARKHAKTSGVDIANFVIIFDSVAATASRVEAAVVGLGNAFRIADNVWSLSCELTAVGVRNALAPYLSPTEKIFVVDATHGRASWQNFAPEHHSKISAAYTVSRKSKCA